MAGPDRRITNPPGGTVSSPSGGNVIIIIGGVSYNISVTNLHSALSTAIANNALAISDNADDISDLQDLSSVNQQLDITGVTNWNLPASSCILGMVFYWVSSTPIITITSGATTIVSAKTLNSTIKTLPMNVIHASEKASASTITITITGGRADVITFYKTNLTT